MVKSMLPLSTLTNEKHYINAFYHEISFPSRKEEIRIDIASKRCVYLMIVWFRLNCGLQALHYCEFSSSVALHSSLLSRKLNFYSDKLSGLPNTFLSSLAARRFASRSAFVHFQIPITLLLDIISSLHILRAGCIYTYIFPIFITPLYISSSY